MTEPAASAAVPVADIKTLLTLGDAAFHKGDLAAARDLYRRAYDAGDAHGALGIGASYDPFFLRRFHLWTHPADAGAARIWYLRARDLGAPEADARLDRLNATSNR